MRARQVDSRMAKLALAAAVPPHARRLAMAAFAAFPMRAAVAQLPAGATPPTAEVLAARIDSVVRTDILPRGFPSVSIVVTRGGRTLLERAWGVANVTTGQQADPTTTYRIGSVSKQFTAALVLRLVDRGRLSLTDPVGRHLKGLRPEWNAITVEQLLNHTSGLARDYMQVARAAENLGGDALIAMAARDTLVTKPGTVHAYSNTGYMLLGVLIEKVAGKPYGVVLRDEIARPATSARATARSVHPSSSTRRRASARGPSARRRETSRGGTRRCTAGACSPPRRTRR